MATDSDDTPTQNFIEPPKRPTLTGEEERGGVVAFANAWAVSGRGAQLSHADAFRAFAKAIEHGDHLPPPYQSVP
jgi:hypothetical protein